MKIASISAWQIYDSYGIPTVEAEVLLESGTRGRGVAPSGASTEQFEAVELRNGDPGRFRGKSVFKAIGHIQDTITPALRGHEAFDQCGIDELLVALDGTPDKSWPAPMPFSQYRRPRLRRRRSPGTSRFTPWKGSGDVAASSGNSDYRRRDPCQMAD
jgi:hypothetical protein